MNNSITIRAITTVFSKIKYYYDYSKLKILIYMLYRKIVSYALNSFFLKLVYKDSRLIENSVIYKIYSNLLRVLTKMFNISREIYKKYRKESILYRLYNLSFGTVNRLKVFICIFLSSFTVGLFILNILKSNIINAVNLLLIIVIIMSFSIIKSDIDINNIIKTSITWNFLVDIFTIDEEGI